VVHVIHEPAVFALVLNCNRPPAKLNLSPATMSRRLAARDVRLGVRLVQRTTCPRLTDEGAASGL
jgi:regulatory helix-turn-helix LysR family protein